ncbi:MAG: hypothetical protein A2142_03540 [candidate division Zixibacteria bacterium RBG_16_48_11]|nr:MAG: hypothetical protein A2142_03540 [candidate division Zixibacteria bacterium RBG_16_48_11]
MLITGLSCSKKKEPQKTSQSESEPQTGLSVDAARLSRPFPSVILKDLRDKVIASDQILHGKNTVVMFISPTCEPCSEEIAKWKPVVPTLDKSFQVIGVSSDPVSELVYYVKEYQINFQVYSDPAAELAGYFSISTYPTVVGVTPQGIVKFIRPGYSAQLSPARYLQAF